MILVFFSLIDLSALNILYTLLTWVPRSMGVEITPMQCFVLSRVTCPCSRHHVIYASRKSAESLCLGAPRINEFVPMIIAIEKAGNHGCRSPRDRPGLTDVQPDLGNREQLPHEAKVRFSRSPIFRGTP